MTYMNIYKVLIFFKIQDVFKMYQNRRIYKDRNEQ